MPGGRLELYECGYKMSSPSKGARESLVSILQLAYSGELAAAYAYRGHWQSVQRPEERGRIQAIEEEEWHHRRLVGDLLQQLAERPDPWREKKAAFIGRAIGFFCHVSGWHAPMYGAGK